MQNNKIDYYSHSEAVELIRWVRQELKVLKEAQDKGASAVVAIKVLHLPEVFESKVSTLRSLRSEGQPLIGVLSPESYQSEKL